MNLHWSTHLYPTLFLDILQHASERTLQGLHAPEPRSLPLGGGPVGTSSTQGATELQAMSTSGLEISVQAQETVREHWASFAGDLELIVLL